MLSFLQNEDIAPHHVYQTQSNIWRWKPQLCVLELLLNYAGFVVHTVTQNLGTAAGGSRPAWSIEWGHADPNQLTNWLNLNIVFIKPTKQYAI